MIPRDSNKGHGSQQFFMSILILFTLIILVGFTSLPTNAQLLPAFTPIGFLTAPAYFSFPQIQIPTYPFFSPFNPLGVATSQVFNLPGASVQGGLVPISPIGPLAVIAGATTVFVPATATDLRINVKVPGVTNIQLTSLVAPLTVFVYPSGYTPPPAPAVIPPPVTTPIPVVTPTPITTPASPTVITSVITTPTATVLPAVLSGSGTLFPFYFPIL